MNHLDMAKKKLSLDSYRFLMFCWYQHPFDNVSRIIFSWSTWRYSSIFHLDDSSNILYQEWVPFLFIGISSEFTKRPSPNHIEISDFQLGSHLRGTCPSIFHGFSMSNSWKNMENLGPHAQGRLLPRIPGGRVMHRGGRNHHASCWG